MNRPRMKVFISYRTDDSYGFSVDFKRFLFNEARFEVYLGNDTLPAEEWQKSIPNDIERCHAFIAVIGPNWAHVDQYRDINNSDDIVRKEVELGLRKGGRCFRVMLDGVKIKKDDLPETLKDICARQWVFSSAPFSQSGGLARLTSALHHLDDQLRPKPIALLSSTLSFFGGGNRTEGLDYFTTLVMTIVQKLKSYHQDVILKVPIYASDDALLSAAHHQRELLRETIEHLDSYCGLIVAPFKLEYLDEDLAQLMKDVKDNKRRFPVCTIDKAYGSEEAAAFQKLGVTPPPGFICNGEYDGGLAADSIIAYVKRAQIFEPNVVVVQGLQGSEPRIQGFVRRIAEYNLDLPDAASKIYVAVSKETPFLAEEAKAVAEQFISDDQSWTELIDSRYEIQNPQRQPRRVDAFFCCNDEMALGVCEYLEDEPPATDGFSPVVVGFDGIASVRRRIEKKDQWLLNTVDVRVREQVDGLVKALLDGLENGGLPIATQMIRGELFNSLHVQRRHVDHILAQRAKAAGLPEVQARG